MCDDGVRIVWEMGNKRVRPKFGSIRLVYPHWNKRNHNNNKKINENGKVNFTRVRAVHTRAYEHIAPAEYNAMPAYVHDGGVQSVVGAGNRVFRP